MQFLYADDSHHFMNMETFEQISVDSDSIAESSLFLKESNVVRVVLFNGGVLSVELPAFVELEVAECEPGVRGDTVSGASKPAKLETGASVQVPLFINQGDVVKVDTRTKSYIERV